MKFQRMLSNGKWHDEEKPERIAMFIEKAVEREQWFAPTQNREPWSEQEIRNLLTAGVVITYDTDWYAQIRDADALKPQPKREFDYPGGRVLDCGHTIHFKHEAMNTARGSSCEACYDRMSN